MQRRRLLAAAPAALLGASAPRWAHAQAKPPLKIGILGSFSNFGADYSGKGALVAAQMAVDDAGGNVAGRTIEIVSADTLQNPDVASGIARKWFDEEGVEVITDIPNSAIALAVMEIARDRKKIMMVDDASTEELTGKNCAPTVFNWVMDTYNLAHGTAEAVLKAGGKTWFFLATDLVFGTDHLKAAVPAIEASGGTVKGIVRHPINNRDFASYLLQAQGSGAQIIALANGLPDNVNSIKQAVEFGIPQGGQTLVPFLLDVTDVHTLGLNIAGGMYAVTGFYWDHDDDTRAWSKRYFQQMNAMPTMHHAGIYSGIAHYLKAVAATGGTDGPAVAARMRAMPVDDFFAKGGRIRPDGRLAYPWYLAQVKKPGESRYPWDYYDIRATIPVEEAYRPLSASQCPAAKT